MSEKAARFELTLRHLRFHKEETRGSLLKNQLKEFIFLTKNFVIERNNY
jgi:hypothetical protein